MKNKIFLVVYCLYFSLSSYDSERSLQQNHLYVIQDVDVTSISFKIIDYVVSMLHDQKFVNDINNSQLDHKSIEHYSELCSFVDWTLKDFKKICVWSDTAKVQHELYQLVGNYHPTTFLLMTMQRNNRSYIKDVMKKIENMPNADYLQLSLKQLYHALHEVKKDIGTIDKRPVIDAWYIYINLLFLHMILMQGIDYIEITKNHKVDQQAVVSQMLQLVERFKHSILSGLTIKRKI